MSLCNGLASPKAESRNDHIIILSHEFLGYHYKIWFACYLVDTAISESYKMQIGTRIYLWGI